jgi:hypothetical protein
MHESADTLKRDAASFSTAQQSADSPAGAPRGHVDSVAWHLSPGVALSAMTSRIILQQLMVAPAPCGLVKNDNLIDKLLECGVCILRLKTPVSPPRARVF